MSGHRKWSEVRDARLKTDEDRARYAQARQTLERELDAHARTLKQVRRARRLTQQQIAKVMKVSQAQVSRVENQADLYLSTLRSYIQAMGGELELRVVFPEGEWCEVTIEEVTEHEPVVEAAPVGPHHEPVAASTMVGADERASGQFSLFALAWPSANAHVFRNQPPSHSQTFAAAVVLRTITGQYYTYGRGSATRPSSMISAAYQQRTIAGEERRTPGVVGEALAWLVANGELTVPAGSRAFVENAPYEES